ncbi:MAG: glycerol kinase GlpK [Alphaproteobacteria bacterium]|nr:glycerol kinase GlpK [Alphaproteobacteria bacterium]
MDRQFLLAIDQGTTSSRAILFDARLNPVASGQYEFAQIYPRPGWVEHDPEAIWQTVLKSCRTAIERAGAAPEEIARIGITNQRETTLVWDKTTGEPIYNAIVWQDRRTDEHCGRLKQAGHEPMVSEKTGLLLDPYFSASKIAWLLENVEGARARAEAGELVFGTMDTWLIWRLTGGRHHRTDATNAARTLLFNIHDNDWDDQLLDLFDIPRAMMAQVLDCAADFGTTEPDLFGAAIMISGVAGDQQAATVGQACFEPGMMKSTYGTGCFALLNTGARPVASNNRLLTTIAYRLEGQTTFALEGSIFMAGAVVQWLREALCIIDDAAEAEELARKADPDQEVYLVPAFTGLGAPYWDAKSRGAIFGLTRNSGRAELARAALESVAFQTRDLLEAMKKDWPDRQISVLRVDGGMSASDWTMQALADQIGAPVDRPTVRETTAMGAAYLAGLQAGMCPPPEQVAARWSLERRFEPSLAEAERQARYGGWKDAVSRTLCARD